jgi:hypothetical protein
VPIDHSMYIFGSKRVYIKREHDRVICRVGGGYMSMDEFIEVYTPIELERHA